MKYFGVTGYFGILLAIPFIRPSIQAGEMTRLNYIRRRERDLTTFRKNSVVGFSGRRNNKTGKAFSLKGCRTSLASLTTNCFGTDWNLPDDCMNNAWRLLGDWLISQQKLSTIKKNKVCTVKIMAIKKRQK